MLKIYWSLDSKTHTIRYDPGIICEGPHEPTCTFTNFNSHVICDIKNILNLVAWIHGFIKNIASAMPKNENKLLIAAGSLAEIPVLYPSSS